MSKKEHNEPETESKEPEPAASPAAASPAVGGGLDGQAVVADIKTLPTAVPRLLYDPAGALTALHRPGNGALIHGLVLGVACAILIPVVQTVITAILWESFKVVSAKTLLQQCLGGVLFLVTAVAATYMLRPAAGERGKDWKDDFYLVGSAMVFFLAGVILGGIFSLFKTQFFATLGGAAMFAAGILAALTLYAGLQSVVGASVGRALWIVAIALTAAVLVGSILNFHPASSSMGAASFDMGGAREAQEALQRNMQDMMRNMGR